MNTLRNILRVDQWPWWSRLRRDLGSVVRNRWINFDLIVAKGWRHWIGVVGAIVLGLYLGHWLGTTDTYAGARFHIYQWIQSLSPDRRSHAKEVFVVTIGDDEYWKGDLARRVPLKRKYLAELMGKLGAAEPKLIALDIQLRSQTPDGSLIEHTDYAAESDELLAKVQEVSKKRKIVLARTLFFGGHGSHIEVEPAIYDKTKFARGRVFIGHIEPPNDIRRIPMTLDVGDGKPPIDSFAAAIIRAIDPEALKDAQKKQLDALPYGSFMSRDKFKSLSADKVMHMDKESLSEEIGSKTVIVGGTWHTEGYGRGRTIDSRLTPVGELEGVFIHANYVESLLSPHTYKTPLSEWMSWVIELVLALLVVAIYESIGPQLLKAVYVAIVCLLLCVGTYLMWQNVGLYFELFPPLVLVVLHAAWEQVKEWREDAKKYHEQETAVG